MVTLPLLDQNGAKIGDYDVDPDRIAPKINKQLMHDVVVMYLANQRQGSNKTKTRGEVAGSTKKMYRQKGTGRARMGSKRTPQRRGGGHANARQPRSYYYRLNRKAVQAATKMAIASKIKSGKVLVVDKLTFDEPKTRKMAAALQALGVAHQTVTVTTDGVDRMVYRCSRNIPGVLISPVSDLNALVVLRPSTLVFTKAALDRLTANERT